MAVRIASAPSSSATARRISARYRADLAARGVEIDPEGEGASARPGDLDPPSGLLLVARAGLRVVGAAGLRDLGGGRAEVKQMWVAPAVRRRGVGRALLARCEHEAWGRFGARSVVLDTHPDLAEAVALYRSAGYREVRPYNENRFAGLWFEKALPPSGEEQ